jgi:hypothetical protein
MREDGAQGAVPGRGILPASERLRLIDSRFTRPVETPPCLGSALVDGAGDPATAGLPRDTALIGEVEHSRLGLDDLGVLVVVGDRFG